MKKYEHVLKKVRLFEDLEPYELESMLLCLNASVRRYDKGEIILLAGDNVKNVGVILSGNIEIIKEDVAGNRFILARLGSGEIFGETVACAELEKMPATVMASEDAEILTIDFKRIVTSCKNACAFHSRLIQNLLAIVAAKNIALNAKISILSKKTTREKLIAYLTEQMSKTGKPLFKIPFNRNELADYLCVDRSAMSRELCRMRDEGMIEFWKNSFKIKRLHSTLLPKVPLNKN